MPGYVIGWLFHATWLSAFFGYLYWKGRREHLRRMAEYDARDRADEERHVRRMAEWDEERRKKDEEYAEWDRRRAALEAETERIKAEIAALDAQAGSTPAPAP